MKKQHIFGKGRVLLLVVGLLLVGFPWWRVLAVNDNLVVRHLVADGVPLRYLVRESVVDAPGVVVAHGFSGSQQLMLGYGYTLAKVGYGVMLLDFSGHGANPNLRPGEEPLLGDVDAAYSALINQPEVDGDRVAILGHSMGSSAAMRAGIDRTDRYRAVVAISPSRADVTPAEPRNLLLQAGSLEQPFAERAGQLLQQAGGVNEDFGRGLARDFRLIPNVEHISILFHPLSHRTAREWLDQTFGMRSAATYTDRRILWYGIHLVGWLLLGTAVSPLLPRSGNANRRRAPWHWLALIPAPLLASGGLALLAPAFPVSALLGVRVGGALGLWFLMMGLLWLGAGWRPQLVTGRSLLQGVLAFAFLWMAFGALAQLVWLPWLLIPERLLRWPLLALALLPWGLASGYAQQGTNRIGRLRWWLAQSLLITAGLAVAVALVPDLFFLTLVLPVFPIVLALMAISNALFDDAWTTAVSNALFFGWLTLAVFPLAG